MDPCTSIYIIGAQCTGKTTLVNALHDAIRSQNPNISIRQINEVARGVLKSDNFTRDDITNNPCKALELQNLILSAQYDAESQQPGIPALSDRSGVDPLVYAAKYGPPVAQELLQNTRQWQYLCNRMRSSLVILCPPHHEWLDDDGIRLMASSWQEWQEMHDAFSRILTDNFIAFVTIPDHLMELRDRVDFVFRMWTGFPAANINGSSFSGSKFDCPNSSRECCAED